MNHTENIVVVGGGGHAKVLIGILKKDISYAVIGYTDEKDKGLILGYPYIGSDSALIDVKQKQKVDLAVIGQGTVGDTTGRKRLKDLLVSLGFDLPVIVSKDAVVGEAVTLGKGTVVFDGAVINPSTRIGECGIINTNSTVEHDCRISDHVHIATGATVCGGVQIGGNCLIGAGAIVGQYLTICPNCIIGAGAVVIKDISEPGTYVGNPTRRILKK